MRRNRRLAESFSAISCRDSRSSSHAACMDP
jgi:hypothetical protein